MTNPTDTLNITARGMSLAMTVVKALNPDHHRLQNEDRSVEILLDKRHMPALQLGDTPLIFVNIVSVKPQEPEPPTIVMPQRKLIKPTDMQ